MSQSVTILYDGTLGVILKHGDTEKILEYLKSEKGQVMLNMFPVKQISFDADQQAAEWINEAINCSGNIIPKIENLLLSSVKVEVSI